MNAQHRDLISVALTLCIIGLTLFIIHRFIPSILWAGVIAITTYPLYLKWRSFFGSYHQMAAFLFTFLLSLLLLIPLTWFVGIMIKELQLLVVYLQLINEKGGAAPDVIRHLPWVGNDMVEYWDTYIGQPGNVKAILSNLHVSLAPVSYYVKQVGSNLAHRGFQLGFTILTLFFFFRDADALICHINRVGHFCLNARWFRFANRLPSSLRSTVNGTILVGLGVGFLMGICYAFLGLSWPTLIGFITAVAAMVPFVVPIVFAIVAFILISNGAMFSALLVIVWGTLVMFIADHFVKPFMIGGAIHLPFLAVLFGILGGVETLGFVGLFVGPLIMVLFITLWQEASYDVGEST